MPKFPVDAPKGKVVKALESLGFRLVREGNHIAMERLNPDATRTPLTMPNHRTIKSSTLRALITQARIPREEFLAAYEKAWDIALEVDLDEGARGARGEVAHQPGFADLTCAAQDERPAPRGGEPGLEPG